MGDARGVALEYSGTLTLDDQEQTAALRWKEGPDDVVTVMQLDASGEFDPGQVFAAWEYFSGSSEYHDGQSISVRGFLGGHTQQILHVIEVTA